jgi:hypothetical protein
MRGSSRAMRATACPVPSCEPSSTTTLDRQLVIPRCAANPVRQVSILAISSRAGTMIATLGREEGTSAGSPSDAARWTRNCRRRRSISQPISQAQTAPASSAAI